MKQQKRSQKMKIKPSSISLMTLLVLSAVLVTGAYAMTVTPGSGTVQVGSTTTIPIILDQSPANLGYMNVSLSVSNPSVAQITGITYPNFPNWIVYNTTFPSGSMFFKEQTLSETSLLPATTNLQLAVITVQGLQPGTTSITVTKGAFQWVTDTIVTGYANGGSDTLSVTSGPTPTPTTTVPTTVPTTEPTTNVTTEPTTTIPTTAPTNEPTTEPTTVPTTEVTTVVTTEPTTTVPTTAPTTEPTTEPTTMPTTPVGPSGSVYFSTTPSGADIFVDGSTTSSGTTPTVLTLAAGTHHATLQLDGYKIIPINFNIEQGQTTIIVRTLLPGTGLMPAYTDVDPPVVGTTAVPTTEPVPTTTTSGAFKILSWEVNFPQIPSWSVNFPKITFGQWAY